MHCAQSMSSVDSLALAGAGGGGAGGADGVNSTAGGTAPSPNVMLEAAPTGTEKKRMVT